MTVEPARGNRARRLRWTVASVAAFVVVGTAVAVLVYQSTRPEPYRPGETHSEITRTLARDLPDDAPQPALSDVTVSSGLGDFVQFAGDRSSQLPEDMGSGAAWGDFDNDGDEDLLLVASGGALDRPPAELAPTRLYENLGDGTFRPHADFPEPRIVGMGAAWGDFDNDGWPDLVVTAYDGLLLYHNEGGSLVRDEGIPDLKGFWAGAAWGDYDRDGDLDLYVCGYVRYVAADADRARATLQYGRSVPYTLNPASYEPERNLLFRNDGEGSFEEIGASLGVDNLEGRSLGAVWHDLDADGWLDLYVANDISDNVLYRNLGGTFEEISHAAWVADYRGAMGLAVGDWNRDGDDDLFVSHWVAQENALYDSQLVQLADPSSAAPVPLRFIDVADQQGLGQIALRAVGWGAEFVDLDGDGWLDLVVTNGSTFETTDPPGRLQPQHSFLFWNGQGRHFYDLAPLNEVLAVPRVGRGLAVADYDDDGDVDILIVLHGEGVRLLRNEMQHGNWIKLRLRNQTGDGEGSRLAARVGSARLRRAVGGASYLSQSSRIVHLGLGGADAVEHLEVTWPDGESSVYEDLAAGATWELIRGEAAPRRSVDTAPDAAAGLSERERLTRFWERQREGMDALKRGEDCAKAIPLFREALALQPEHEDARYYLATCLAVQGETPEAIEQLERLTRVQPQSHRAYKQLGILRAMNASVPQELDAATAALERSLELNREETGSLLVLGEVALLRGERETAEERLGWVSRTNPRAAGAHFLRSYLAWSEHDTERALELLARVREARGEDWVPTGMTSEGDVRRSMHAEVTPLSRFWMGWAGDDDLDRAFAELDAFLRTHPAGSR